MVNQQLKRYAKASDEPSSSDYDRLDTTQHNVLWGTEEEIAAHDFAVAKN